MGEEHKKTLAGFFPAGVLNKVRVVRGRAPEPSSYPQLRALRIRKAPPFSDMAGITFQDVVVHIEALTLPLSFHELVHRFSTSISGCRGLRTLMCGDF